jgi:type III pantothenate kinase
MQQMLLIDAGNTRIKTAVLDDGHIGEIQAVSYDDLSPEQGFKQLLAQYHAIKAIVMVHVLGDDFAQMANTVCNALNVSLHIVVSEKAAHGVSITYEAPEHYGADRFVGIVAAHALYPQATCVVIDCGTAITVDVVNQRGEHQGGVIYPGIQLCQQSLSRGAKGIRADAFTTLNNDLLANDTQTAVVNGCVYGAIGAIEGFCEKIHKQHSGECKYLICGGDAQLLSTHLSARFILREGLLFDGLNTIANNIKRHR